MQHGETRVSAPIRVMREDVQVMYATSTRLTPAAIQAAWTEFEKGVGLKGRKFVGAVDNTSREYRVCAQINEGDDPAALGFEVATLPGGAYLRVRLQGKPPAAYAQIPALWQDLVQEPAFDPSRPTIEYYRSLEVIDLLLPVV